MRIYNTVNMLICVQNYYVELRCPAVGMGGTGGANASPMNLFSSNKSSLSLTNDMLALKNLECVLVIDELRVISFDRFGMKMPSSVAFDDQVRVHLSFLRHFLMKGLLVR